MKILEWGIYAVVFCLPLYLVGFKIFGIPTTVLEILIYVLFVILLFNKFIRNTKYEIRAIKPLFVPIILILLGVSLVTVFSSDLRTSAGIWKAWFVDPILFFIVLVSVIKNSEQVKKVLFSLFLSATVVSVISLVYLISGKLDPVGRLQGFYNSPNYLAMYLAPALIIGVGYYVFTFLASPSEEIKKLITRKKIIPSIFILSSIVCLLLSLIFAKSFGAWLGIIATIGIGLFLYYFKLKKIKLAVLFLCLFVLAGLILGYLALTYRESSLNARLIIWQKSLEIFKTNSILGIGPGTFESYFPPYPEWGVPQPHNIFLAFLLQAGIIGFIGFAWLLIWFFQKLWTFKVHNNNFVMMLGAGMVYILVHGLVDTTYWKNDLAVIFWLIVGLRVILKKEPQ